MGEPEVRRWKRNAARPTPLYENIPSVSHESDKAIEDRPFLVFSETSAETQANCNRPRVAFETLTVIIEESESENDHREVSQQYEVIPPRQLSPPVAKYEQINKNDSDDKIIDDNGPRVRSENARERSKETLATLAARDVDQSYSDVPAGR